MLPAIRQEIEKAKTDCEKAVADALAKQQQAATQALARLENSLTDSLAKLASDPRSTLTALEAALSRVTTPITAPPARPVESQGTPQISDVKPSLGNAIVAFVEKWAREKTVGCQFDVLWNHLKEQNPALTIGSFQDSLRACCPMPAEFGWAVGHG